MNLWILLAAIFGIALFIIFSAGFIYSRFFHRVEQGKALIVNKAGGAKVVFDAALVLPIIHRPEYMDISVKTIELKRSGKEGLICKDNIRADIQVTFFVRVNKTQEDVLKVAGAIGTQRASDQTTLEELFIAKFSEALKTVGKQLDFVDLYTRRDDFKDQIVEVIGRDLNGYVLEDAAIDFLEQTPLKALDDDNILDAQGIRKITELTAVQHVATNLATNLEKKSIRKQDVETTEAILELDKQQADAMAKQKREIASIQAREAAEVARVQAEERLKAERARLKTEEELGVQEQNKSRQVEVAQKNRERVVGIEHERVAKDRMLEAIIRERETELGRIAKEKAVEIEKKEIADVIRQRIVVEKAVAEEEERIKELRMVEEAKRTKQATVITAEAEAQESLIKQTTAAQADETSAKHEAKKRIHLAEADLEAADKQAQAQIRMAEGAQASAAADGLAQVKVKEAGALAHEKYGLAEAKVTFEKMSAEARGKEATATAVEKLGLAEANVNFEKASADARGKEAHAVAVEKLGLAEAVVEREQGSARASAIEAALKGEAAGLHDKAGAMKALDDASREHEEFRLKLDKEKVVELETIRVRKDIAQSQALVLAEAFKSADIDIIGGDGRFFDQLMKAASLGQSADKFIDNSDVAKTLLKDYLSGEANLPADLKEVLANPRMDAGDVKNLTLSAFLGRLATGSKEDRANVAKLLEAAKELGLADKGA